MVFEFIVMIALLFIGDDGRADVHTKHRFERPTDWAEDSTVSDSRKQYYEEVYVSEIEDWKRENM